MYGDDKLGHPEATTAEIQTAKNTLFQIVVDTKKISKKYKKDAKFGDDLATYSASAMDACVIALHNKMRELTIKRRNGSTFLKTTSWAIYHRFELKQLIEEIIVLIDNIENLRIVHMPSSFHKIQLIFPAACANHLLHFIAQHDGIACRES